MEEKMKNKYLKLFLIFLRIGAFTFGGGYAMIPLIEREIVDNNKWLDREEFMDAIAVCQSVPGALAVNTSVFIGYKIGGILGAFASAFGVIIPSFTIIAIIAAFFAKVKSLSFIDPVFKGIGSAVVALVLTAAIRMFKFSYFNIIIILASFICISFLNINPFIVIVSAAIIGVAKNYRKDAKV